MPKEAFYESLPAKRMGSGALFFDEQQRILLVQPTYKDFWEIPGGVVEKDESPLMACMREIKEELGLDHSVNRLLCVDYNDRAGAKTESLMFIFYGGLLSSDDLAGIKLDSKELKSSKFVAAENLSSFLPPRLAARVYQCTKAIADGQTLYLENQQIPGAQSAGPG